MGNPIKEIEKVVPETLKQKPSKIAETILLRYFSIEGKTAVVKLNFDTFSELVDQSVGDDNVEKLNSTLFEKLAEIFALIPRKYEIDVRVRIKDFGDYTVDEAERIVKENVSLLIYSMVLERRKKIIAGLSLLGGGIALLLTSYFLNKLALPQIFFDIINISGTLLVWESANITLIERRAEIKRAKQYISKFKNIKLESASDK